MAACRNGLTSVGQFDGFVKPSPDLGLCKLTLSSYRKASPNKRGPLFVIEP